MASDTGICEQCHEMNGVLYGAPYNGIFCEKCIVESYKRLCKFAGIKVFKESFPELTLKNIDGG